MIQSIGSNSSYWYQQTRNQARVTAKGENTVTAENLVDEDEKTAKSSLSLMDIMGLMQNSKAVKQEELKEDAKDGDINAIDFFVKFDTDGDGEITSEEMTAGEHMMPPPPIGTQENQSEEGFSSATDTDGDGAISSEEYEAFIEKNGITDALSAEDFFAFYDTDGDGRISTDEVKAGVKNNSIQDMPPMGPPPQAGLPSEIDTDGDGSLSADEYENLVSALGIEDAPDTEDFFAQYDTNGDGEISAEEAQAILGSASGYRMQAMNAYENSYLYLDSEEEDEVDSIA